MKIRTKILLLFTIGALVPLLTSNFFATWMAVSALEQRISDGLTHSAEQAAGRIGDHVERSIQELAMVVDAVPFENFPAEELHRALEVPYRQLPGTTIVALLDEEGRAVANPYYRDTSEAETVGREGTEEEDLSRFAESVPLKLALTAEVALGPVYLSATGIPRLVMARSFPVGDGSRSWVLAIEVSLAHVCELVSAQGGPGSQAVRLLDMEGRVICNSAKGTRPNLEPHPQVDVLADLSPNSVATLVGEDGAETLTVMHEVGVTGWRLTLEQREDLAMEPVRRSVNWTAIWVAIALAIALVGGAILSKEISEPIVVLERAATSVAGGEYDGNIELTSRDELGKLAGAFNHMTKEIRAWNTELTERVEERTRELKEAREQILQTQKLAAVGELGSGVAHEINNPLTGVIGMAQLLKGSAEPGSDTAEGLESIVTDARRVAEVVDVLLKLSQSQVAPEMQVVETREVVESVLTVFTSRIEERELTVETRLEQKCQVMARENDLRLVLNNLIDNAVGAVPEGGKIEIDTATVEGGAVRITVADDGPGMTEEVRLRAFDPFFTTQPPGSGAKGLGLSLVHQLVTEHEGRVVIDSSPGFGTRVTLYLTGASELSRA